MDDDTQATGANSGDQLIPDDNAPDPGTPPVFSEDAANTSTGGDGNEGGNGGGLDESFPIADSSEADSGSSDTGPTTDASDTGLPAPGDGTNTELI